MFSEGNQNVRALPQSISLISHGAEICTHVHISVKWWCITECGTGAFLDFCNKSHWLLLVMDLYLVYHTHLILSLWVRTMIICMTLKCLLYYCSFVRGTYWHKWIPPIGLVMWFFDAFFDVNLIKVVHQTFQMPMIAGVIILIWYCCNGKKLSW